MPGWEFNKIQYQKLITFNRNHKFQLLVFLVISYKLTEKKNYLEVYSSYMYMNRNLAGQVQKTDYWTGKTCTTTPDRRLQIEFFGV